MRQPVWTFGPFEFNATTFRLSRDGRVVPLEPKALDVLRLLLERAPAVVEKADIFDAVWRGVAVTDNALTRVIAQLRRALDDDAKNPTYIETVATRGYRMAAPVHAADASPQPAAATSASPGAHDSGPAPDAFRDRAPARWFLARGAMAAVAGTAVVAALALFAARGPADDKAPVATAGAAAGEPDVARFAALQPVQVATAGTYDAQGAFSPDGNSIAFTSDRTGTLEIYVVGLAPGSVPAPLTSNGHQNIQPAWSPDGQFIAYVDAGQGGIWIVPSRGGTARRLTEFGARPAWSPDGRRIVFHTLPPAELGGTNSPGSASVIAVADVESGEVRRLTQPGRPDRPHVIPQWSADGSRVYFAATAASFTTDVSFWSLDVASGALRAEGRSSQTTADYAPFDDGRQAFIAARNSDGIWHQRFAAGASGSLPPRPTGLPVEGSPSYINVSADGRSLLWTSISSESRIMALTLPAPAAASTPATALPLTSGMRAVSAKSAPDGRLAFSGGVRGGPPQIWIGTATGRAHQVTLDGGEHYMPSWTQGARQLVYVATHDGEQTFNAVDVETGAERRLFALSELPMAQGATLNAPVALNVIVDAGVARAVYTVVSDGIANLWTIDLKDGRPSGRPRQVTLEHEGGSFPRLSEDGRWIAYHCAAGASTHICVIHPDGSGRRQLTTTPGQRFIGSWKGSEAVLAATLEQRVWNVVSIDLRTGVNQRLTAFTSPTGYVRYPNWNPAAGQVIFERNESTARIWKVELP